MANLIQKFPSLPRATTSGLSLQALASYDAALNTALFRALSEIAQRLNRCVIKDGSEGLTGYTVTTLPDATTAEGAIIYVSDETGGPTLAFSDGTDWRRVQDRAVVS